MEWRRELGSSIVGEQGVSVSSSQAQARARASNQQARGRPSSINDGLVSVSAAEDKKIRGRDIKSDTENAGQEPTSTVH
jgi:hypothetical protein